MSGKGSDDDKASDKSESIPTHIYFTKGVRKITIRNTREEPLSLEINLLHTGDRLEEIQFSENIEANCYLPEESSVVPTGTSEEVNLDSITVKKFPLIVGTADAHYRFDSRANKYEYTGLDYTYWRVDTLIENPEDHHLYPLRGILQPESGLEFDRSDSSKIIIPKTVTFVEGNAIYCTGVSEVDLSFCTLLNFQEQLFTGEIENMTINIPVHWFETLGYDSDSETHYIQFVDRYRGGYINIPVHNITTNQTIANYITIQNNTAVFKKHGDTTMIILIENFYDITYDMEGIDTVYFEDGNYYLDESTIKAIAGLDIYVRNETIKTKLQEQFTMSYLEPNIQTITELIHEVQSYKNAFDSQKQDIGSIRSDLDGIMPNFTQNKDENTYSLKLPENVVTTGSDGIIPSTLLPANIVYTTDGKIDTKIIPTDEMVYMNNRVIPIQQSFSDDTDYDFTDAWGNKYVQEGDEEIKIVGSSNEIISPETSILYHFEFDTIFIDMEAHKTYHLISISYSFNSITWSDNFRFIRIPQTCTSIDQSFQENTRLYIQFNFSHGDCTLTNFLMSSTGMIVGSTELFDKNSQSGDTWDPSNNLKIARY